MCTDPSVVFFFHFVCYFFIYCYADHPDLHSFPTRRSSDLKIRAFALQFPARQQLAIKAFGDALETIPRWLAFNRGLRSEEHTSELQSLRHLVCRLLLEKKKKSK